MSPGTIEVIAVCQSLQQVAEKCQRDPESCWYFHQTAVPCLLALAVQASTPGNFPLLTLASFHPSLSTVVNSTATCRVLLVLHFAPAEVSFEFCVHIMRFHFNHKVPS